MISAFSAANGVVLGQIKTEEKSNEIIAISELLKLSSFARLSNCHFYYGSLGKNRT